MALISYDVTLLIAEHVDMESLLPFMLSCKANYQLIRGHERSIVKAKIANKAHDPTLLSPLGALLSSPAPRQAGLSRNILEPVSFAVAKELESRERQINRLFSSSPPSPCGQPLMHAIRQLPLFQNLPPHQMDRLIDGFKDACTVADHIADCAALLHPQQQPPKQQPKWAAEHEIHLTRQSHIHALPPIRLAFLTLLTSLLGMEYAQTLHTPPDSDPFHWERVTAFKETFLRHGTGVVCALLCPPPSSAEGTPSSPSSSSSSSRSGAGHAHGHDARGGESARRYYRSQVDAVLAELLEYERGHWASARPAEEEQEEGDARPVEDGLHMTMLRAFRVPEEVEEEEDQPPPEDVAEEEGGEDVDGGWLFKIDVLDYDAGDADGNSMPPRVVIKPDAREAMVLRWVQGGC
jgi:hypothetical protein